MISTSFRTHSCGMANIELAGSDLTLCGWVRRRRDHGGLIFIDLVDFDGCTQIVFRPESSEAFKLGENLRPEYVVRVVGKLNPRPEGTVNSEMKTGEVELEVKSAELLSAAETPPFVIQNETEAKEELRLKYRYLDLRRPEMQKILRLRHDVCRSTRSFLDKLNFCEVETPVLTKPTPEGARDFLVPSRINQGQFYALPQSPQLFKQVLMCSGLDRYYQIVKCFRDEDLRANRQPEFTQVDIEMSFVEEKDVQEITEGLLSSIWESVLGVELTPPFSRISYAEAMDRFGSDAPDTRFEMELKSVSDIFIESEFKVFRDVIGSGGEVMALCLEGGGDLSRKEFDDLVSYVKVYGAKGLAWIINDEGKAKSPIAKFISDEQWGSLCKRFEVKPNDALLFVADSKAVVRAALGALRIHLAEKFNLIDRNKHSFLWVERFPLLEHDPEQGRYVSVHHPFTSPCLEDCDSPKELEGQPEQLLARAYDIVPNGQEIGGGSIRIHRADLQRKVFSLLGISDEEASAKFGFLLDALTFGAPPHGGIALGLDRIVMILSGVDSIREVIAFPKTQRGQDLMAKAPAQAKIEQLVELGIKPIAQKAD